MKKSTPDCGLKVRKSENRILLAFLLNLFFTFVEIWGSVVTGSVTILSDAIHDFGDCIALGMAWRMEKFSKKPPNERYHFGYRRFSVAAGLVNNLILLTGGVILIVTSVQRFFAPREINGRGMLLFAIFGILMNGIAMLLTSKGKNINERTISMHMLEDVLTWVAVFIVGCVMCFFDLPVLDSVLSICMTLVIFCGVARNLRKIFCVMTVRSPLETEKYRELQERLGQQLPLAVLRELRLFSMDGEENYGEVILVTKGECRAEETNQMIECAAVCCGEYGIHHTVVQVFQETEIEEQG